MVWAMDDDGLYPLRRDLPLWERTYDTLERLIIHRKLPAGSRLVEAELAARLDVSRNPVREAIRALEAAGWVEVIPRRGTYVISADAEEGDHLFEVRALLEPEAAALATERIRREELEELEELLEKGTQAAVVKDTDATVELNAMFHRKVFAAARNPVLYQVVHNLEKRAMWHFSTIATARGLDSWHEHSELLGALVDGDQARAASEMRDHVNASREAYRRAARAERIGTSIDDAAEG